MIGNEIEYDYYYGYTSEPIRHTGIVVDAYTEITGSVRGDNFLGFGEVSGNTNSRRKYKVQHMIGDTAFFEDIYAWQLKRIIKFSGQQPQEEKIIDKTTNDK